MFLKRCLGVRMCVPDFVVMSELRRVPLALAMVKASLRFWNRVQALPSDDLMHLALTESIELADRGVTSCWAAQLVKCLRRYGVEVGTNGQWDVDECLEVLTKAWVLSIVKIEGGDRQIRSIPDEERDGFKVRTYCKWFCDLDCDVESTFWYCLHRPQQIRDVACLRLGSHNLNIDIQRRVKGCDVKRSGRLCVCCDTQEREDEMHMLHCSLYQEYRDRFGPCMWGTHACGGYDDDGMRHAMNVPSTVAPMTFGTNMAIFLGKCFNKRAEYLLLTSIQ